jgi:hypothetical protein
MLLTAKIAKKVREGRKESRVRRSLRTSAKVAKKRANGVRQELREGHIEKLDAPD